MSYIPPSNGTAVRAAGLGAGAGQAAEVALVRVVCAVDAAVAELGDGQARRVVSEARKSWVRFEESPFSITQYSTHDTPRGEYR